MSIVQEFQEILSKELSKSLEKSDSIHNCGASATSIIKTEPEEVLHLAYTQLHAFPFKDVPECWRRLYTEAALWKASLLTQNFLDRKKSLEDTEIDDWLRKVVEVLDLAIIMTGAPGRKPLIDELFEYLSTCIQDQDKSIGEHDRKLRKVNPSTDNSHQKPIPSSFPELESNILPSLINPISKADNISLSAFQQHLNDTYKQNTCSYSSPLIITNSISHWPALTTHPWSSPPYLLSQTLNGHRIVPVEIGRSYTDANWSQKLLLIRDFMSRNMFLSSIPAAQRGYLAQHDLFSQVPSLRNDICVPDYCYASPPSASASSSSPGDSDSETDGDVLLNAWFGPAHTLSPAHTDPHHNILAQVVGWKYVRLYAPSETAKLYPRGTEGGINMSNTSEVDVGMAMRIWEGWNGWSEYDGEDQVDGADFEERFPELREARFSEGVLAPGDCLYIPKGYWHYVRSLSPSFSVSFWWD